MLDEYADAEPLHGRGDRFIPIGRISEFLPSAGVAGSESGFPGRQQQLELPLRRPSATPAAGADRAPLSRSVECQPAISDDVHAWAILKSGVRRVQPVAGLAYGCAIGTAAAAALLLAIRIAVL